MPHINAHAKQRTWHGSAHFDNTVRTQQCDGTSARASRSAKRTCASDSIAFTRCFNVLYESCSVAMLLSLSRASPSSRINAASSCAT
jgi:hypothetical protein